MTGTYLGHLCESGMLKHKWRRVVSPSRDESLRCHLCKHIYDTDLLDNAPWCPRCQVAMDPPKTWVRVCDNCGVTG